MSPRSPTATPSASNRARWVAAPIGSRIAIRARFPDALPQTRCHGTCPALTFSAAAEMRAPPGIPASSAIWP